MSRGFSFFPNFKTERASFMKRWRGPPPACARVEKDPNVVWNMRGAGAKRGRLCGRPLSSCFRLRAGSLIASAVQEVDRRIDVIALGARFPVFSLPCSSPAPRLSGPAPASVKPAIAAFPFSFSLSETN